MSSAQRPLGSWLQAPLATLTTVGFVITLFVPPAASRPPAPGGCSAQVPRISAGCCSRPPSTLLGLRGGSTSAGADDEPWEAACEEGDAHAEAGEWASATASFTRGLTYDSTPPRDAARLYFNRAISLLQQESFVEAGADARAGLAIFSSSDSLGLEPCTALQYKGQLTAMARDADLGAAAEAFTQGSAHQKAGEWASAVACYTRGLAYDSIPAQSAACLYSNRAEALLEQGSFVKAGRERDLY